MQNDPTTYILGASLLSGCIGFLGCALMVSRRIRQAEFEGWLRGRNCFDRDKEFYLEGGKADFRDKATLEASHRAIHHQSPI